MRYIFLVIAFACQTLAWADNISVEQATVFAEHFFKESGSTRSPQLRLIWDGESTTGTRTSDVAPAFYIFNRIDEPGFVIVAGDDLSIPVLGYSSEHSFQTENMPSNIKAWLMALRDRINNARSRKLSATTDIKEAWLSATNSSIGTVELQLETADWNQLSPYNALCPKLNGAATVTGCVATAIAIIMRYHQWPDCGEGTLPSYSYTPSGASRQTVPSRTLGHTYNWADMPLTYNSSSSESSKTEVATLMLDCGVMSKAQYNTSAAGGTAAYTSDALNGMLTYMKYDKGVRLLQRDWYPESEWIAMMKQELRENGPVLYGGANSNNEGHQFVLDGYTTTDYFGLNWGWGGMCNGYYLLSNLNPSEQGTGGNSGGGFSIGQDAVVGLKKATGESKYASVLALSPSSTGGDGLTTSETTFTLNKTFIVKAEYVFNFGLNAFNGYVVASLIDKNGNLKEDISDTKYIALQPYTGSGNANYSCTITRTINRGDRIRLRFRGTDDTEWQLMPAHNSVQGEILVKGEALNIDENTSFRYNRNSKMITVETIPELRYKLTSVGQGTIEESHIEPTGILKIDAQSMAHDTYTLTISDDEDESETKTIVFKL